jgi:hypothetical protein
MNGKSVGDSESRASCGAWVVLVEGDKVAAAREARQIANR